MLAGGPDSLLDDYSAARRPIAAGVVTLTDRMTRLATLPRVRAPAAQRRVQHRRSDARGEPRAGLAAQRARLPLSRAPIASPTGGTTLGTIEADYLVIGAGATAMAFVDTLVSETSASVVVVDRNHRPGGHWTTAYPFVRLHQPSAYYGVNSRPLGNDTIDSTERVPR